ncbi:MAG: hypothetical protein KDD94_14690 [Calditrichaeota bacterium]|nr:hypothetical protein [Calditrichota bacterium]
MIQGANKTLKKVKIAKNLVPEWSIYITVPFSVLATILGGSIGVAIGTPLLTLDGINLVGRLLWAGRTSNTIFNNNNWYLLNEKGNKKNN